MIEQILDNNGLRTCSFISGINVVGFYLMKLKTYLMKIEETMMTTLMTTTLLIKKNKENDVTVVAIVIDLVKIR